MPMGINGLGNAMDSTFMQVESFLSIGVILVCFVIGYLIKHYTKIENSYIPLIMIALGIIVNTLLNLPVQTSDGYTTGGVTISTIFVGGVSGLASTGLYEMLAKSFGLKKNNNDSDSDDNAG